MSQAQKIILHNYPQSPVAEKVRVALGIKSMAWHSVEIPRIPPKPFLTKLTGGYRRTPVMQIGADIYCDSHLIIQELENRQLSPSLFPMDAGLMRLLSRWADGDLFDLGVKIILGANKDNLPADFAEDRGRLYLLNDQLSDGRTYILGDTPAAIDAQFYYVVWFIGGRWEAGPAFLSEFPHLLRWAAAVKDIGHGQSSDMTAEQAIKIASESTPAPTTGMSEHEPQGLTLGQKISVAPDVDGGEQPVAGALVAADAAQITLHRQEPDVGDIHVHFPRTGYRINIL